MPRLTQSGARRAPMRPAVPTPASIGPVGPVLPPAGDPQPGGAPGLLEQPWRIVSRHWPIILATTLLVALAAYLFSSTRPDQFTATSALSFEADPAQVGGNTGFVDPSRQAATREELLRLDVIAEGAAERLDGVLNAQQVRDAVELVSSPDADVVSIEATTEDRRRSALVANAYARSFEEFRREGAQRQYTQAIESAQRTLADLLPEEAAGERGQALRERLEILQNRQALQTSDVRIVQEARAPREASAPRPVRTAILGGVLGALLGLGLAALRERADRTIKEVDELERAYGVPIIARVPRSREIERGKDLALRGEEAEAFRMLRSNLRYYSVQGDLRSLLVTSAMPEEGKSTVARYLAETMATMGDRTVLVMADLHHPGSMPGPVVDRRDDIGLSGVLVGRDLDDAIVEVAVPDETNQSRTLAVLPPGPMPPNPSELLESRRMGAVLEELQERYDVVIVDSPPAAVLSDTLALVGQVSGVVVVSAVGQTTRDAIRESVRSIGLMGGNLLGVIANFAPAVERSASSYYTQRAKAR